MELVQSGSAAHTFGLVTFLSCLHVVFTALAAFPIRTFSGLLNRNISPYWLLFCIIWPCRPDVLVFLNFRFLCSLTLFPLRFFCFFSILLSSSLRKKGCSFWNWISSLYFPYWTALIPSLEAVISSGEESEVNILLRKANDFLWDR